MIIEIEVNNKRIKANRGETILSALNRNGIKIPTLCHIDELFPTGACRICMVELLGKESLVPACSQPVEEWMKILTHSPKVIQARRTIVELLLANHPDDCLYCERNGNCELQNLAEELLIRERKYKSHKEIIKLDTSSATIIRDHSKCITCGRCVRVCEEIQGVSAIDFINKGSNIVVGPEYDKGLYYSNCIGCGQCIIACPTGALIDKSNYAELQQAIYDTGTMVVAQISPTVAASIAEMMDIKQGKDALNIIVSVLKKIGVDKVFDTSFGIDINIMQNAEFIKNNMNAADKKTLFSSCCPAWTKYMEKFFPELGEQLIRVKSPQSIMGKIIRETQSKSDKKLYSISITPCTAKKFEAQKEVTQTDNIYDVNLVLTTRELLKLIKLNGIDIEQIQATTPDVPFNTGSSSARLYGVSGGVCEATIRHLNYLLLKEDFEDKKINALRQNKAIREYTLKAGNQEIRFAAVSGMKAAGELVQKIKDGQVNYDFVEIMACTNGCINGGGQPIDNKDNTKNIIKRIYNYDESAPLKQAYKNTSVNPYLNKF